MNDTSEYPAISKTNCVHRDSQTDNPAMINQQCQTMIRFHSIPTVAVIDADGSPSEKSETQQIEPQSSQNPPVPTKPVLQELNHEVRESLFAKHWKSLQQRKVTKFKKMLKFNETSIPKIKNQVYNRKLKKRNYRKNRKIAPWR